MMRAILKDTRTNEILVELLDNLEEELTDNEIQEFINDLELDEETLENVYVDYE